MAEISGVAVAATIAVADTRPVIVVVVVVVVIVIVVIVNALVGIVLIAVIELCIGEENVLNTTTAVARDAVIVTSVVAARKVGHICGCMDVVSRCCWCARSSGSVVIVLFRVLLEKRNMSYSSLQRRDTFMFSMEKKEYNYEDNTVEFAEKACLDFFLHF